MEDTMVRFSNDNLSSHFLSNEDIRRICPMALQSAPTNPNVSDRYVQANTMTVIEDLAKLGWYPVEAKQCRAKKNSSGIRSFHMIVLQNPDVKIVKKLETGEQIIDVYPRIILTNSHDGFNSFKFMVGMFRLVCSNGLVCGEQISNMSIRHINYNFEELRRIVASVIEQVPNIVTTMNKMRSIIPTEEQKVAIATEVLKIRKGVEADEKFEVEEEVIDDILTPVREEDKAPDLWTIFNICQEKMIKGGFSYISQRNKQRSRLRKQRGITSIKKAMEFNQRLGNTAPQYLNVA
jgi:hypothetical protein